MSDPILHNLLNDFFFRASHIISIACSSTFYFISSFLITFFYLAPFLHFIRNGLLLSDVFSVRFDGGAYELERMPKNLNAWPRICLKFLFSFWDSTTLSFQWWWWWWWLGATQFIDWLNSLVLFSACVESSYMVISRQSLVNSLYIIRLSLNISDRSLYFFSYSILILTQNSQTI